MKRFIPFFLFFLFPASVFAQEVGTLTVTKVASTPGTGVTLIDYDFSGDAVTYDISAEVSFDNGGTFVPVPDAHLKGAMTNVAPGGPYSLIWEGGKDFPETYSDETVIRIGATSTTFTCGDDITFAYGGSSVTYGTVSVTYEGIGQRCWLDRNLGAERVAESSTDEKGYGDLFQWGRLDDGHQLRDPLSGITSDQSSDPDPGHSHFITDHNNWYDGSDPDDLWKEDGTGINNPCPPGWRVPTEAELEAELENWSPKDLNGAYASPLKWTVAGGRASSDGSLSSMGFWGYYWSSTLDGSDSRALYFGGLGAHMYANSRALGRSVRCLKD